MTPMSPERLLIPVTHALTLHRLVAARLPRASQVWTELERDILRAGSDGTIPLRIDGQLCARAEEWGFAPGLGYAAGFATRIVSHGVLGYALMSSATLGEALKLWIRFAPTLAGGFEIRQAVTSDGLELTIHDLHPDLPGRIVAIDRFVAFTLRLGELLAGVPLCALKLHLPARMLSRFAPATDDARLPPMAVTSSQPRILVPSTALNAAIATGHPAVLSVLLQQCELEHARARQPGDWVGRVERLLERRLDAPMPIEEAARALCVSTRTLKRRLQEEGHSYRAVVDDARKHEALRAMANPSLRIEDIAAMVGYTDQANFARAFRRWTGKAPGAYRAQHAKIALLRQPAIATGPGKPCDCGIAA
jgi:AraC-like DNA-binding protein